MLPSGVVAVVGSRSVTAVGAARVAAVSSHLAGAGCSLVVGCCTGVDVAALAAVPVASVRVLCAFGPGGAGSGPWSAVAPVAAFARAGGAVSWWAGGGPSVALSTRLVARTRAVAKLGQAGLVVFLSSPGSRGSLVACRQAARLGRPVLAFPQGFHGAALPSLGPGQWVPVERGGVWSGAWVWRSAQAGLF